MGGSLTCLFFALSFRKNQGGDLFYLFYFYHYFFAQFYGEIIMKPGVLSFFCIPPSSIHLFSLNIFNVSLSYLIFFYFAFFTSCLVIAYNYGYQMSKNLLAQSSFKLRVHGPGLTTVSTFTLCLVSL